MEASSIGTKHQPQTHARGVRNDYRPRLSDDNHRKEDSVTISEEARQRQLLTLRKLEDTDGTPFKSDDLKAFLDERRAIKEEMMRNQPAEYATVLTSSGLMGNTGYLINKSLEEKVENVDELMQQLHKMLSASSSIFTRPPDISYYDGDTLVETWCGDKTIEDLEWNAAQREAGKKLAEYIAQNYLENPDEAKAFMDAVNKLANEYEKRDEERLNSWVERKRWIEADVAKRQEEAARTGTLTDPETIKARLNQIAPEADPFSDSYIDAWQSLVIKGSSIKDWFANLIDRAKSSIKIEDLLGKYSNISVS